MSTRILILGTGLIGASVGLALKAQAPESSVFGWDADPAELAKALDGIAPRVKGGYFRCYRRFLMMIRI